MIVFADLMTYQELLKKKKKTKPRAHVYCLVRNCVSYRRNFKKNFNVKIAFK